MVVIPFFDPCQLAWQVKQFGGSRRVVSELLHPRQAGRGVRRKVYSIREVQVLLRQTLSGL